MKCICPQQYCFGCQACYKSCKLNRICLREGIDGFKYAYDSIGGSCSFCDFICPVNIKNEIVEDDFPRVYAVQLKDENILMKSTSGGMFYAISKYVFKQHGVIFGAVYNDEMKVQHIAVENYTGLSKMHGSKYVQSDLKDAYNDVKKLLDKEITVLFTGVPCQIAGLYSFLNKEYKKLITMDLICSGVPSPKLFHKYIEYLQRRYKKIVDFKFRDKHKYGCSHTVVIDYFNRFGMKKQKTIKHRDDVSYYVAYGKENCFMDACYHCQYNTLHRISDFTVGGFWSLRFTKIKLDERKGVSLVLANTNKALSILEFIKEIAFVEESQSEIAIIENRALVKNTPIFKQRDELFEYLGKYGYKATSNKYYFAKKYKYIRAIIPNSLKDYIKKIIRDNK